MKKFRITCDFTEEEDDDVTFAEWKDSFVDFMEDEGANCIHILGLKFEELPPEEESHELGSA